MSDDIENAAAGDISLDHAKERLRLAQEALVAVGGKPLHESLVRMEWSCASPHDAASIMTWFAAQAAANGGDYVWYLQAADVYLTAAHAQGCG